MEYYIQVFRTQHAGIEPIWKVENNEAIRIDVLDSNPAPYPVGIGEDVTASLEKHFPGSKFYRLSLKPGQYYPVMMDQLANGRTEADNSQIPLRGSKLTP